MNPVQETTEPAAPVRLLQEALDRLRARISRYVLFEGLGLIGVGLGIGFWLSLGIDWWFEPARWVRAVFLAAAAVMVMGIAWRSILSRLLTPLSDSSLALLLERSFRHFEDSLATSVALHKVPPADGGYSQPLLDATRRTSAHRLEGLDLARVLNPSPLRRSLLAALVLAASIGTYAALSPTGMGTWARRALALSNELWPRWTDLVIDGFENGMRKVARGDDLTVIVKARTSMRVPRTVDIAYQYDDGGRGRERMTREGVAREESPFQEFSFTFESIPHSVTFGVRGGDDRIEDLRIEVVDSPAIRRLDLDCRFPDYTGRTAARVPGAPVVELPRGTEVQLIIEANKPLVRIGIDCSMGDGTSPPISEAVEPASPGQTTFAWHLPPLDADAGLTLSLLDADGIESREPIRVNLTAVEDQKPSVAVRLSGIGSAVTPQARIPLVGKLHDDYGLDSAWISVQVDELPPVDRPFVSPVGNQVEVTVDEALDLAGLDLKPKQHLLLSTLARDNCGLSQGPQQNHGERFLLDVVSVDELLMMLVARELNLRQRLEATQREVEQSRDALVQIEWPSAAPAAAAGTQPPGEGAQPSSGIPSGVLAERALQNSRKDAHDVASIAAAFDEIHAELVNNRVENDDLKSRVKDLIAAPLHRIADGSLPGLAKTIDRLKSNLDRPDEGRPIQVQAVSQANSVLAEIDGILEHIKKLESYNELLARLRRILDLEARLRELTEQKRKERLRDLLEEDSR
jgi:hypothetical protein